MVENKEDAYHFLAKAYKTAKLIAVSSVSIAGVIVSIVALNVKVSHVWWDFKVPLYVIALVGGALVIVYGLIVFLLLYLLRDNIGSLSFYRSKSKNLETSLAWLENIAYNDSITGIPNSRALKREIDEFNIAEGAARCLILLDLRDFGSINKRFNHWKGDEYLRRFAEMVTTGSRRSEFLYKKRPAAPKDEDPEEAARRLNDVKAFRKNSGGDEFFILLEGTILDGLGYLNRLQKREREFQDMARQLFGEPHHFQFHAGLLAVGSREPFDSVNERIVELLRLSQDEDYPLRIYWNRTEVPKPPPGSISERVLAEVEHQFRKERPKDGQQPGKP